MHAQTRARTVAFHVFLAACTGLLIRKCYAQAAMYNRLEELKELVITDPRAISHVRAHASPQPSSCTP